MTMRDVVFFIGMMDGVLLLLGGLVSAFIFLMGWDAEKFFERVWPAIGCLILSNVGAAALFLGVAKVTQ